MVSTTPIGIDINGFKFEYDASSHRIVYASVTSTAAATPITFHDHLDGSNAQVPTGKKWTIIYIVSFDRSSASHKIIQSDDLDGTTNSVDLFNPQQDVSNSIFISTEITAGKYVTFDSSSATSHESTIIMLEEDA